MTLLAHWPLITDGADAVGNHDLSLTGSPGFGASHRGGCLSLDGITSYATGDSSAAAAVTGLAIGTIMAWFRAVDNGQGQTIISISDADAPASWVGLRLGPVTSNYDDEAISFIVQSAAIGGIELRLHVRDFSGAYLDGRWHHVAVVVDGAANTIYIDGVDMADRLEIAEGSRQSNYLTNISSADLIAVGMRQLNGGSPADLLNGDVCDVRIYDAGFTAAEVRDAMYDVTAGVGPQWSAGVAGDYPLIPAKAITTIRQPNGQTAVENDLDTWAYAHHPLISHHAGVLHAWHSIGPRNEDSRSQHTVGWTSTDAGQSWDGPNVIVPPQSAFASNSPGQSDAHVTFPTASLTINDRHFAICHLSHWASAGVNNALALLGREVGRDGVPIGDLFRVTPELYTPAAGASVVAYNAILGPPLLAHARVYGHWQGSNQRRVSWRGQYFVDGAHYTEFATIPDAEAGRLMRWMRRTDSETNRLYQQWSDNAGDTWFPRVPAKTQLPNNPSAPWAVLLDDGRTAILLNPEQPGSDGREPLAVAISDPGGLAFAIGDTFAIEQGSGGAPVIAGFAKGKGWSYPTAVQVGNYLHVIYSRGKEAIRHARIVIPGRPDDDSDITATSNDATEVIGRIKDGEIDDVDFSNVLRPGLLNADGTLKPSIRTARPYLAG